MRIREAIRQERHVMKRLVLVILMSLMCAWPAFGKTHSNTYSVPCSQLWDAVMDTIKNSGSYSLVVADNNAMTASYTINGAVRHRENSVHLEPQGTNCEMQTQSSYSGWAHDDAGDFKTRVEASLAKLKGSRPPDAAKPEGANK